MNYVRYALAIGLVCVFSASAFAKPAKTKPGVYDVCLNLSTDAKFDSTNTFFTGVGIIVPGGTLPDSSVTKCQDLTNEQIGTFFASGSSVAGLGFAGQNDEAFVIWHFRIERGKKVGAFDTMGPVESSGAPYPQTIIGSTGGLAPAKGVAEVTPIPLPSSDLNLAEFEIDLHPPHGKFGPFGSSM
ncbi:hypothetical protein IMX07_09485 [bacterium]|nr:hypothetical protein [bacterium]